VPPATRREYQAVTEISNDVLPSSLNIREYQRFIPYQRFIIDSGGYGASQAIM
jgi:hypothetical protein